MAELKVSIDTQKAEQNLASLTQGLERFEQAADKVNSAKPEASIEKAGSAAEAAGPKLKDLTDTVGKVGSELSKLVGASGDAKKGVSQLSAEAAATKTEFQAMQQAVNGVAGEYNILQRAMGLVSGAMAILTTNAGGHAQGWRALGQEAHTASTGMDAANLAAIRAGVGLERLATGAAMGGRGLGSLIGNLARVNPAFAAIAIGATGVGFAVEHFTNAFEVAGNKFVHAFDVQMRPAAQRLANELNQSGLVKAMSSLGTEAGVLATQFVDGFVIPAVKWLANLGTATDDVSVTLRMLGTAVSWLASAGFSILHWALDKAISLFNGYLTVMRSVGEGVGSLIGLIAGGLVNAFSYAWDKVTLFVDVMNLGFAAMGRWIASQLPDWLTGPLGSALDYVIAKAKEWGKALDDAAQRVVNAGATAAAGIKPATAATDIFGQTLLTTSQKAALFNGGINDSSTVLSKMGAAASGAADGVNKLGGAVAYMTQQQKAAFVFVDQNWINAENANKASQATADAYYQKMRQEWAQEDQAKQKQHGPSSGPSANSWDPRVNGPNGTYPGEGQSYYDRLKQLGYTDQQITTTGTGKFDTRPGSQGDPKMIAEQKFLAKGAGNEPQQQFDNPAAGSDAFTKAGDDFAAKLKAGLEEALNNPSGLQAKLDALATGMQGVTNSTLDEINALNNEVIQGSDLLSGLDSFSTSMMDNVSGLDMLSNTLQDASNTFDKGNADLAAAMGELTAQSMDLAQAERSNTSATYQETLAQDANTNATQADTAANYADAAAQSASNGGGGGGSNDQSGNSTPGANDQSYFDVGGVVGAWGGRRGPGLPASAWNNAPHFGTGGLTSGIPIVAHDNEAIIPLAGGAVPVRLQGFADIGEKIINVGTVAHSDADRMLAELSKIANGSTDLLAAFNTAAAAMEAAASRASVSSGSGARSSTAAGGGYIAGDGGGGGGMGGGGEGSGIMIRGWYGTSNHGGYLRPSALQSKLAELHMMGQDKALDAYSKNMGGAAEGIENTNMLPGWGGQRPGMTGIPVMVHPNEAITPLSGGRAIPVTFPQFPQGVVSPGWGGQAPGMTGGQRGTVINHYTNNRIQVRDPVRYESKDQTLQTLLADIGRATTRIGQTSPIDDPTRRQTGWGGQAPGMTNPGISGTAKF